MAYPTNSWAILPATDALFNKTKVSMTEMAKSMGSYGGTGTLILVERDNGNGKVTLLILSSSGRMDLKPGSSHKAHHDQNFRSYGYLTVKSVFFYEVKDGVVTSEKPFVTGNFPLFVFK